MDAAGPRFLSRFDDEAAGREVAGAPMSALGVQRQAGGRY
jgi:hypothetical protein